MNANEMADELESIQGSISPLEIMQATKMLRQQQAEIESLRKADLTQKSLCKAERVVINFPVMLRKMWSGSEVQAWISDLPPLYTHPVKTLTDEEIIEIGNAVTNLIDSNEGWIEFARAILRKAQEK